MKSLCVFMVFIFSFVSCKYQEGAFYRKLSFGSQATADCVAGNTVSKNLDYNSEGLINFSDSTLIDSHVLSNENTFAQNMDLFIDNFVNAKDCVKFDTLVDYDTLYLNKSSEEIYTLRLNLFKQIKDMDLNTLSKDEKVAFYINAYNFLAIEIVNKYLVSQSGVKLNSISDVLGKGSFKAFNSISFLVAGTTMTLDILEKTNLHSLLTNGDGSIDARFHFAVICAAKGCPVLLNESYKASKLDEQLNFITIKSLELFRNFEQTETTTKLTQLFNWYKSDFESHKLRSGIKANSVENFIREFDLSTKDFSSIEFINYDWALNIL